MPISFIEIFIFFPFKFPIFGVIQNMIFALIVGTLNVIVSLKAANIFNVK